MLFEFIFLAFAIILVLVNAQRYLPNLVMYLRPSSLSCWFEDSAMTLTILSSSPRAQEWVDMLSEQGFFLLGVKAEKLPLWGEIYREISFYAPDERSYAGIVIHPTGAPSSLYFYTPLKQGGMVFTRNFSQGIEVQSDGLSVKNVVSENIEEIYRSHQVRLELCEKDGFTPVVHGSKDGRIAATRAFYASGYYRRVGKELMKLPAANLIGSGLLFLIAIILITL